MNTNPTKSALDIAPETFKAMSAQEQGEIVRQHSVETLQLYVDTIEMLLKMAGDSKENAWLPMATAPRENCTEILLLTKTKGVCQAWWAAAEGEGEEFEGLCWVCCDDEFTIEQPSEESMVLGWMPLPPGTPKLGDLQPSSDVA